MALRSKKGGRVTPKGTTSTVGRPAPSGRYTPPLPRTYRESPKWVPILMGIFLVGGLLMIILNYIGVLPESPTNWYLLGGLGLITAGFIVATKWQ